MITVTRSSSWLRADIDELREVLNEALKIVGEDSEIINIQCKTEASGLSRFWIYSREKELKPDTVRFCAGCGSNDFHYSAGHVICNQCKRIV